MKAGWCCCLHTWNSRREDAWITPLLHQSVPIKWFTLRYGGTGAELKGESRLLFFNSVQQDKSVSALTWFYTWNKLIIHIYTSAQYTCHTHMISCHTVTCLVALSCRVLTLLDLEHPVWLQLWTSPRWICRNQERYKSWCGFKEVTGFLFWRTAVLLQKGHNTSNKVGELGEIFLAHGYSQRAVYSVPSPSLTSTIQK